MVVTTAKCNNNNIVPLCDWTRDVATKDKLEYENKKKVKLSDIRQLSDIRNGIELLKDTSTNSGSSSSGVKRSGKQKLTDLIDALNKLDTLKHILMHTKDIMINFNKPVMISNDMIRLNKSLISDYFKPHMSKCKNIKVYDKYFHLLTRTSNYNMFEENLCDILTDRIDRNELWIDIAIEPIKAIGFIYIPIRIKATGTISGASNG